MERLYAPWRSTYLMDDTARKGECLFCRVRDAREDDASNLVLWRGDRWYAIVNRYPYTTGHVMVVCNRHVEGFADLDPDERGRLVDALAAVERAVRAAYRPDGLNVGANLGRSAGAGIVGHLHVHVVPRWNGDTNFMSTVGEARVVSEALEQSWERIRRALEAAGE